MAELYESVQRKPGNLGQDVNFEFWMSLTNKRQLGIILFQIVISFGFLFLFVFLKFLVCFFFFLVCSSMMFQGPWSCTSWNLLLSMKIFQKTGACTTTAVFLGLERTGAADKCILKDY